MPHIQQTAIQMVTRIYNERGSRSDAWGELWSVLERYGSAHGEHATVEPSAMLRELRSGFDRIDRVMNALVIAFEQSAQGQRLRQRGGALAPAKSATERPAP